MSRIILAGALEQIKGTDPSIVLLDSIALVFSEARFVARLPTAISDVRVAKDASATEVAATIRAVSAVRQCAHLIYR